MKLEPKWHQTGTKLASKWHQTSIKVAPKWHQTSIKVAHQGCKFAANLHQTCTPSFVFFCFFVFCCLTCFLMWFIVFLWKPFGISGQQMDYNSMCPVFLNTIYVYIYIYYLVTTTLFSKPKSNMYFQHVSGKCTIAASNPSTQLNFKKKNIYIYIFSNPLIKGQHWVGNKTHT